MALYTFVLFIPGRTSNFVVWIQLVAAEKKTFVVFTISHYRHFTSFSQPVLCTKELT